MNNGERNELIIKLKLIEIRDTKSKIIFDSNLIEIHSVGFIKEYSELNEPFNFNDIENLSDSNLKTFANKFGIDKAPGRSKSDVYINGIGVSLKSLENAPPAIINHTTRIGFENACSYCNIDIKLLDEIIEDYWYLRKYNFIKEDIHNNDINSPFKDKLNILKPILNYFLFDGSGVGLSKHRADLLLDYKSAKNIEEWQTYNRENAVDQIWNKLVFSLRSKGMPDNYPLIDSIKLDSIKKWTVFYQNKFRGALHVRTK